MREAAPDAPRRAFLWIGIALLLALAAGGGLVYLRTRPAGSPSAMDAAAQAATALRGQKAASLKVSFFDQTGVDVTGDLTVTAGGTAHGTLTDAGGGKADYLASGEDTAVRGDEAWWARRDAARVGALKGLWVRPEALAFPIEAAALEPDSLAGMIDWVRNDGASAPDVTSVAGQPVVGLRRDGWTFLFTRAAPHRLLWFGGATQERAPIAPLQPGNAFTYQSSDMAPPTPPYVSVLVNPPPGDAKATPFPGDTVAEDKTAVKRPKFDVVVNASTCRTATCTWSVTVTNKGNASGEASVIASVSPGMPQTEVRSLGIVQPGASATTATMSFPNPAPTNQDVSADYRAEVFSKELHGSNLKVMRRLQEDGIVVGRSELLSGLDPSQMPTALLALDGMRKAARFDPDKAVQAMENAVTYRALPEVGELVRSGRLENPEILYTKLPNLIFEYDTGAPGTPVHEKLGSRRQLQIAAGMLRQDPAARVALDGVEVLDGKKYRADVLVHAPGKPPSAIQAKSVSSDSVAANVRSALAELQKSAPPNSARVVWLHLEAPAGYPHAAGRDYFDAVFDDVGSDLCKKADEVVVVNQAGLQRWTKQQLPGCG
ncbi:hypothetical protein BJY16_008560 [Actinoplanes octamycinicus]|uniref:CARDB domain-containing protein n=1 Tax=Actinoplanes octamycinicus TaxID=135948 RepID=A0A7W7H6W1_9ACTN|nr:hypothetical protein [Actinoplanes octamycinicus]MBB4745101.1 hypothetical protein [Actinoplanes octamycinicus]GIE55685.1 hypothetical protein Aoc01nite_10870 [Actinoplanes octamycinicus]